MKAKIRKLATFVEETFTEMGRPVEPPTRRVAAVAVIENPCAGKYVEDLSELMSRILSEPPRPSTKVTKCSSPPKQ